MKHLVHDAAGFQLEVSISHHLICGPTVELFSTWPKANHPEPHRLLSLTLPPESLQRLASVIDRAARAAGTGAYVPPATDNTVART